MPSIDPRRRRLISVLGGTLLLGGCLGGDDQTPTATRTPEPTPSDTPTPSETPTGTETPTPTPQPGGWPRRFDGNPVVLDEDGGDLFAVVSPVTGTDSALFALELDGSVRWTAEFEANTHGSGPNEPDEAGTEWSTWLTAETVYLAGGVHHEWWAVRAFDRASGEQLWSLREERVLSIRAVTDDSLLVTAEEIFVPETTHDTPEEPLTSELYRLDRTTGDATKLGERNGVRGATADGNTAYVLAMDSLSAFDFRGSGGRQWQRSLSGEGSGVFTDGDWVVAVAEHDEGSEIAGFAPDGEPQWTRHGPGTYGADTLFVDGTVHVGGAEGVVAIETDGTVAWQDDRPAGWFVYDRATGRVYTRSGAGADAAAAYGPDGEWRWTFDPDSKNAWPTCVTDGAVLATAITGEHADEPFQTVFSVDPESGTGSPLVELDTVFSAETVGDRAYLATDDGVQVFEPSPGD